MPDFSRLENAIREEIIKVNSSAEMITEIKKELNKNPLNAEQIKSQLKILEGMHSRRVKNVEDYKNDLKRLKEIEGK